MNWDIMINPTYDSGEDTYTVYSIDEVKPEHKTRVALLMATGYESLPRKESICIEHVGEIVNYETCGPLIFLFKEKGDHESD